MGHCLGCFNRQIRRALPLVPARGAGQTVLQLQHRDSFRSSGLESHKNAAIDAGFDLLRIRGPVLDFGG
jgi:hypothetical protein